VSAGLVLASKSVTRRAVLEGAGVPFVIASSGVDEDAAKADLLAKGANPRQVATALAEEKALAVSGGRPGWVVRGEPAR
jgi:septum formation protein